jgi:thiol-disulfide isomerase/thioredoxin
VGPLRRWRLGLAALAALVPAACAGESGDALPAVELPALDGFAEQPGELDTGELDGPAVLNLWAAWCVPCRTELPEFQRASEEHPGVRFVGVDEGFVASDSVAFLGELGVTYDQFVDEGGAFADRLEISELPATVVIDDHGDVVLRHLGALTYDDLVATLADLA